MENTDKETLPRIDLTQIEGIILDYGGTLDTGGDHWSHIIRQGYEQAQVLVEEEAFRDAYIFAERELARTLHILPHHNFRDLLGIKIKIELQYLAASKFIPAAIADPKSEQIADYCYQYAKARLEEARPVLEALHARFPMVLVTNFYGNVQAVLEDFGLTRYFDRVIESAVVGVRKPDPKIFALGLEALNLPAEKVLVVGDSLRKDIEPAESLGCPALWLKGRGWTPEEDAVLHPGTIGKIAEILAFLDADKAKPL